MKHYSITAESIAKNDAIITSKNSNIAFGTTTKTENSLQNPAELFLGSFAACILKNVERFSGLLKFSYHHATIKVDAIRLENPPRMDNIKYLLTIYGADEKLNKNLLKKNIEKFGTIFNTVGMACTITGEIHVKTIAFNIK